MSGAYCIIDRTKHRRLFRVLEILLLLFGIAPPQGSRWSRRGFIQTLYFLLAGIFFIATASLNITAFFEEKVGQSRDVMYWLVLLNRILYPGCVMLTVATVFFGGNKLSSLTEKFKHILDVSCHQEALQHISRKCSFFFAVFLANNLLYLAAIILFNYNRLTFALFLKKLLPGFVVKIMMTLWPLTLLVVVKVLKKLLEQESCLTSRLSKGLDEELKGHLEKSRRLHAKSVLLVNDFVHVLRYTLLIPILSAFVHVIIELYYALFTDQSLIIDIGGLLLTVNDIIFASMIIWCGEEMSEYNEVVSAGIATLPMDRLGLDTKIQLICLNSQLTSLVTKPEVLGMTIKSGLVIGLTGTIITYLVLIAQFN